MSENAILKKRLTCTIACTTLRTTRRIRSKTKQVREQSESKSGAAQPDGNGLDRDAKRYDSMTQTLLAWADEWRLRGHLRTMKRNLLSDCNARTVQLVSD